MRFSLGSEAESVQVGMGKKEGFAERWKARKALRGFGRVAGGREIAKMKGFVAVSLACRSPFSTATSMAVFPCMSGRITVQFGSISYCNARDKGEVCALRS